MQWRGAGGGGSAGEDQKRLNQELEGPQTPQIKKLRGEGLDFLFEEGGKGGGERGGPNLRKSMACIS